MRQFFCQKSGRIPSPLRGGLGRGERRNPDTNFRGAMDVVICIFALSRPPPPTPAREGRGSLYAETLVLVDMKRSIRIAHHNTSISLEEPFWDELKTIAERDGISLNQLVAQIDASRTGNLSSSLRLYVLKRLKERA